MKIAAICDYKIKKNSEIALNQFAKLHKISFQKENSQNQGK